MSLNIVYRDNAPDEILWGSLKLDKAAVMNRLAFNNAMRSHLRLGSVSPMQFTKTWLAEKASHPT